MSWTAANEQRKDAGSDAVGLAGQSSGVRNTTRGRNHTPPTGTRTLEEMRPDTIMVEVSPDELAETSPGVVDVFAALGRQFFWADVVMVTAGSRDADVLDGEVVFTPS